MELQPYYRGGERSNLGNTVYNPARPQGCARARGLLQLYPITRGRDMAAGTRDGQGRGMQPRISPSNLPPLQPSRRYPHPPKDAAPLSGAALQGLDLPATKYYFSCIIFRLGVSGLLAGACRGQAAPRAGRRLAWPRAGTGDLGGDAAGGRGDDSEGPLPAAESVLSS